MKKIIPLLLAAVCFICIFSGCEKEDEKTEIIVFAAASLTETLTELGNRYMADHPNISLVFNFDSSGTLKTQIQSGAVCDIFISAGQKQMNQLDIAAEADVNTEGLDFILSGSRFDILENKVALAVPEGNPAGIRSCEDLCQALTEGTILLAIGNSDVPVGQYTLKIFEYYDLSEEDLASRGLLTYGSNVKELTTQLKEGAVSCGIVYSTDAFSAGLTVVDTATAEMCGQVIYPAAIIRTTEHQAAAESFLEYLRSHEADEVFSAVGFTPIA